MKNEARFFDRIDKEIKKGKLMRNASIIGGIISIAISIFLGYVEFTGEKIPEFFMIILFAIGVSLIIAGGVLSSFMVSDFKICKEILKEIFEEFSINEEKTITISDNFPKEMNLEGKMIFALGRNTEIKVKLYIPNAEDSIGVRVEPKGVEYFTHTVCVLNENALIELKDFLIKN